MVRLRRSLQMARGRLLGRRSLSAIFMMAKITMLAWNSPDGMILGFNGSQWQPVNIVAAPGGNLVAGKVQSNVATETVRPIAMKEVSPGVFVYDTGQNFSGW